MKNLQQLLFVALGVVVGLLLGVVVINATNNAVNEATVREIVAENNTQILDGIAVALAQANPIDRQITRRNLDLADSTFFLVTMDQTAEWLESLIEAEDVELSEEVILSVLAANGIASSSELELYFGQQVNTVDGVLANVYQMLLAVLGNDSDGEEAGLGVCLGLDSDPYSLAGPVIYLYLQIPDDEDVDSLPKDWEVLSGPREESMLWSMECYDPATAIETLTG